MAIAIDHSSARIIITNRPRINNPTTDGTRANFTGTDIQASGRVRLTGAAGESPAGWELGFIQAQWIETNWVYYQGRANHDGSLLLQRGKPPARPHQGCRDTVAAAANVWYNHAENGLAPAHAAFPLQLNAHFFDQPSDSCRLVERNSCTHKDNYLSEAQFEFHFCTVLAVRDPGHAFHQLLHFYWNVHWQASFEPTNFANLHAAWTITPNAKGTSSAVSEIYQGRVTDNRFRQLITGPATQSCNQIFAAAEASVEAVHGGGRKESPVWHLFDVRR